MDCVTNSRLSKNLYLSTASSVDSSQSKPSVSLNSLWVSITLRKVGSFFIARINCAQIVKQYFSKLFSVKRNRTAFSAFTRATFSESPFPWYSLINALSWASWRCSASLKIRDQGFKRAPLEKNSFLGCIANLHFVAIGCFLLCLHNFQQLVAGMIIACAPHIWFKQHKFWQQTNRGQGACLF